MNTETIFELPFQLEREQTLVDECGNIRMDIKIECLYSNLVYQLVNLAFELLREENALLNLACSKA